MVPEPRARQRHAGLGVAGCGGGSPRGAAVVGTEAGLSVIFIDARGGFSGLDRAGGASARGGGGAALV